MCNPAGACLSFVLLYPSSAVCALVCASMLTYSTSVPRIRLSNVSHDVRSIAGTIRTAHHSSLSDLCTFNVPPRRGRSDRIFRAECELEVRDRSDWECTCAGLLLADACGIHHAHCTKPALQDTRGLPCIPNTIPVSIPPSATCDSFASHSLTPCTALWRSIASGCNMASCRLCAGAISRPTSFNGVQCKCLISSPTLRPVA